MTLKDQCQANRLKCSFYDLYSGGGWFEFQPDRLLLTHVFRDFPHSFHTNAVTYCKVWRDHFVPIFSQLIIIYNLIIIIIIITAIEFSLGGSSPYTIQTKQIRINIHKRNNYKKHGTSYTKHSKYKYTHYKNTHTIVRTSPHTRTHTLRNITIRNTEQTSKKP